MLYDKTIFTRITVTQMFIIIVIITLYYSYKKTTLCNTVSYTI